MLKSAVDAPGFVQTSGAQDASNRSAKTAGVFLCIHPETFPRRRHATPASANTPLPNKGRAAGSGTAEAGLTVPEIWMRPSGPSKSPKTRRFSGESSAAGPPDKKFGGPRVTSNVSVEVDGKSRGLRNTIKPIGRVNSHDGHGVKGVTASGPANVNFHVVAVFVSVSQSKKRLLCLVVIETAGNSLSRCLLLR